MQEGDTTQKTKERGAYPDTSPAQRFRGGWGGSTSPADHSLGLLLLFLFWI